jgi:hypothetical protein
MYTITETVQLLLNQDTREVYGMEGFEVGK